jgi:hypothetical protein
VPWTSKIRISQGVRMCFMDGKVASGAEPTKWALVRPVQNGGPKSLFKISCAMDLETTLRSGEAEKILRSGAYGEFFRRSMGSKEAEGRV